MLNINLVNQCSVLVYISQLVRYPTIQSSDCKKDNKPVIWFDLIQRCSRIERQNKLYSPHVRVFIVICTKRNNNNKNNNNNNKNNGNNNYHNHNNTSKSLSNLELKERFIEIGLFIVLCDLILYHVVVYPYTLHKLKNKIPSSYKILINEGRPL